MENEDFWASESKWPHDPAGYIFFARAVHAIGPAMFGDQWSGDEPTNKHVKLLPEYAARARLARHSEAYDVLRRHRPELAPEPVKRWQAPPSYDFTREQWDAARALVQTEHERVGRFWRVREEIARACEAGRLKTVLRPVRGGDMTEVSAASWNTDNLGPRFTCCQMHPLHPFSTGFAGEGFCWIFVEKESLEHFLADQPFAVPPIETDVHLSPYLKLVLNVAKKLDVTPDNQPKIEEIKAALRDTWTGDPDDLKERLVGPMATIMREPESRRGRANPKKKKPPTTKRVSPKSSH